MKLSGLRCLSALLPQTETNVPVDAPRPGRGALTFGRTLPMSTKSLSAGPPWSAWQSGWAGGVVRRRCSACGSFDPAADPSVDPSDPGSVADSVGSPSRLAFGSAVRLAFGSAVRLAFGSA